MPSDMKRAADFPTTVLEPKKMKVTPDPQYHSDAILEHVVREIIPKRWMDTAAKRQLYQTVTTDPQDAITKCKDMIAPWVVEYYEDGLLYDLEHLREKAVSHLQFGPGLYVGITRIPSSWRRYVGQSINCNHRVHHNHESASFRKAHPSLHYEYHEIAEEVFGLDPAFVPHFLSAGLLNVMELWQALVFRSLQESDLKDMLPGGGRGIADSELGFGANVRNPLAQGLSFTESPDMGYYRFKNSPDPIKQAFFEKMKNRITDRRWWADRDAKRESLLRGDIYRGTFGPSFNGNPERAGEDRMFTLHYAYILFGTSFWRRWDESTIRVKCEIAPEGEIHPHCVVRGCYFLVNDPARRLGIRISGIMKCNGEESFCWVNMWGDQTTMRINSLVDFLLDRPTDIGEPRRFLPRNPWVGRPKGIYTSKDLRDGYDYISVLRKHDESFEE